MFKAQIRVFIAALFRVVERVQEFSAPRSHDLKGARIAPPFSSLTEKVLRLRSRA
jgi:hypothetical protein